MAPKGSSAFDPSTGLWIDFHSPADAFIADLSFNHKVPLATIDAILSGISQPQFNASEITLKSGADIFTCVAEFRRSLVEKRAGTDAEVGRPQTLKLAGAPLVFSLVTKYMARLSSSVEEMTGTYKTKRDWGRTKDLPYMSFVDRKTSLSVQQLLFRRVVIDENHGSHRKTEGFLKHPFCGPWVRELGFRYNLESRDDYYDDSDWVDPVEARYHWDLLGHILHRVSHVEDLTIMNTGRSDDKRCFIPKCPAEAFKNLLFLSRLSITGELSRDFTTETLHALPSLQRLEFLRLTICFFVKLGGGAQVPTSTPPPSLKTVIIVTENYKENTHTQYLAWLLTPSGGYAPRNVVLKHISHSDDAGGLQVVPAIKPCCDQLELLYISLFVRVYGSDDDGGRRIMSHFGQSLQGNKSIKVLHFDESSFSIDIRLPDSLEELGLFTRAIDRYTSEYKDKNIHRVLTAQRLPHLRAVILFYNETYERSRLEKKFKSTFPLTSQFCEDVGIRLEFCSLRDRKFDSTDLFKFM